MEKIRQFVNYESGAVVSCTWDPHHGAWVCQSERDPRFECCSNRLAGVYEDLLDAGYQET